MLQYTKRWYLSNCDDTYLGHTERHDIFEDYSYLTIHDCKLESKIVSEGNLLLNIDNSGGFCFYNKILLTDFAIKEDSNLEIPYCAADELYRTKDGRFEYHILLEKFTEDCEPNIPILEYFTIECGSIHFIGNDYRLDFERDKYVSTQFILTE